MSTLRLMVARVDPALGDLDANAALIGSSVDAATELGCQLVVLGGGALTGHPCGDLVGYRSFTTDTQAVLSRVAAGAAGLVAVVGSTTRDPDTGGPQRCVAVCASGRVLGQISDHGVVSCAVEMPGSGATRELRLGVAVDTSVLHRIDARDVDLVVVCDASAFDGSPGRDRETPAAAWAASASVPVAYVNLLGGQDEHVFDGAAFVVGASGELLVRGRSFDRSELHVDLEWADDGRVSGGPQSAQAPLAPELDRVGCIYEALVLATRDYVTKNGFTDVAIGLSGGLDSSLVAAVAVDALGPTHVHGVLMPSRHSSEGSLTDADALADNLGIDRLRIPIEAAHRVFADLVALDDSDVSHGLADENLQPRIRGVILMALSNLHAWLVLTTGNKSEAAVGYSTLYGDTAGAFAVIKDVYKTLAYELCRYRNQVGPSAVIPEVVITKAPSAELRPGQRDDESLPPYDVLDAVLAAHLEASMGADELIEAGYDSDMVRRVVGLVAAAEFKRRQSPLGPRVTTCSLGVDRHVPATNRYRHIG